MPFQRASCREESESGLSDSDPQGQRWPEPLCPPKGEGCALLAEGLRRLNWLSLCVPPESLTFDMELTSECATSPM